MRLSALVMTLLSLLTIYSDVVLSFTKCYKSCCISSSHRIAMKSDDSNKKQPFSIGNFLSGKTAVASEKALNPTLFTTSNSGSGGKNKRKSIKVTPMIQTGIDIYRKANPNPKEGGVYDVDDSELAIRFVDISKIFNDDEESVVKIIRNYPDLLSFSNTDRIKDNFEVYSSKWGSDKALGVVTRNPSLLCVQTTGYGSASVAGDETVYASYLISATRPLGKVLLALLFIALTKPLIWGKLFE